MADKKLVRSLSKYETLLQKFTTCRLAVRLPIEESIASKLGLSTELAIGDSFVPAAFGKTTEFNAHGKILIRKDLPKVSETRSSWRRWEDWHGQEHSGIQIRTIQVYPRELVPPPSEYLTVLSVPSGLALCSRSINHTKESEEDILHIVNLFLEIFGEFEIFDDALEFSANTAIKRLNWKLLPPGKYPFLRTKEALSEFLVSLSEGDRPVVEDRIKTITKLEPDLLGVGLGGFKDYVVFGFTKKNRYVLESPRLGNATYIFDKNWEELSTKTKKEILDGSLHEARVIHDRRWHRDIVNEIKR
jgi:hypothetical protein